MGLAFSQAMAAEGATVILADIAAEAGDKAAGAILDNGGKAEFVQLDVARAGEWTALAGVLEAKYGRLDVVVNNAGVGLGGSIEDCLLDVWQKTLDVNLTGVFPGCRTMLPLLRKSAAGAIINISSIFGIVADQAAVAYCASKGAVRMLTKSAAMHGATMNPPIRVNSVHPGFVETPMVTEGMRAAPEDLAREYTGRTVGLIPARQREDKICTI